MPASHTDLGGSTVVRAAGPAPSRAELDAWFVDGGLRSSWWSNAPGDRYGWHSHPYRKVLVCQEGSIVFHLRDGDLTLEAGDRLDIAPDTEHAATVGADGVVCAEASR